MIFLISSKSFQRKLRMLFSVLNKEGKVFASSCKLGKSCLEAEKVFCLGLAFFNAVIANNYCRCSI